MGKRPHKRQKTEKLAAKPLGAEAITHLLEDDASKDDEERKLESMLFGKPYIPAPANENILVVSDDEHEGEVDGTPSLQVTYFVHFRVSRPNDLYYRFRHVWCLIII